MLRLKWKTKEHKETKESHTAKRFTNDVCLQCLSLFNLSSIIVWDLY